MVDRSVAFAALLFYSFLIREDKMTLDIYKFKFEETSKKYLQVYTMIKKLISNGSLVEDEKLPPIRKLSELLGVNSVTIVKAYDLLESEGYLVKRVGSGSYVSKKNNKSSIEDNSNLYRLDNGNPPSDIFPIEEFKKAINMALEDDLASLFNYDDGNGILELKEVMVDYLAKQNINTRSENIIITSGGQQGIDIISKCLLAYSDIVFIEEPTYSGAIDLMKMRNTKLVSVPLLKDGIDIGILKVKLEKIRPKLLYVMPNFQNPTGISYSEYKKKKILELAEEYNFYILEDDFISDFRFISENNKTLKSYDKNNRVIYIKSFSKILMPGLRMGFMVVPTELLDRAILSKHSSDISTSPLIQKSLYYYMSKFDWDKHTREMERVYAKKYLEASSYINKKLAARLQVIENKGGINFFVGLKRGFSSRKFVDFMYNKKVALKPGYIYYDLDIEDRFFRINISRESMDRIKEAIDIISDSLEEFYEMNSKL